jgi:hypothetical protein
LLPVLWSPTPFFPGSAFSVSPRRNSQTIRRPWRWRPPRRPSFAAVADNSGQGTPRQGMFMNKLSPRRHSGFGAIARELGPYNVTTKGPVRPSFAGCPVPRPWARANRPSGKESAALLQLRRTRAQRKVFSREAYTVFSGKSDMLPLKGCWLGSDRRRFSFREA